MNFKILNAPDFNIPVLVRRSVNDVGDECVVVEAYVVDEKNVEHIIEEEVVFKTIAFASQYVDDFSGKSAKNFLTEQLEDNNIILEKDTEDEEVEKDA